MRLLEQVAVVQHSNTPMAFFFIVQSDHYTQQFVLIVGCTGDSQVEEVSHSVPLNNSSCGFVPLPHKSWVRKGDIDAKRQMPQQNWK